MPGRTSIIKTMSIILTYISVLLLTPSLCANETIFQESVFRYVAKFKGPYERMSFREEKNAQDLILKSIPRIDLDVLIFQSSEEAESWGESHEELLDYFEKDNLVTQPFTQNTETALTCDSSSSQSAETIPYGIDMVHALDVPDYDPSSGISVCVIDSGYDLGHEDLQDDEIAGVGNLCKTSPCPWDRDDNGHGTHVTGTLAALGNNSLGVVGVVRNGLMPLRIVRVLDYTNTGWETDFAYGMYECDDFGANVVNMSLQGPYTLLYQWALDDILGARDDILFVACAGNDGDSSYTYPASLPEFISVGAVDSNKIRRDFSQYNDEVDLMGPGSSVYSTIPREGDLGGCYGNKSGTSMATPHVTGIAALIWSHFPNLAAGDIRSVLEKTAEDLGDPGRDNEYGHGLVDAEEAMKFLTTLNVVDFVWTPISGDSDAFLIGSSTSSTEVIDLDFKFYWLGGDSYTNRIVVSNNGQININADDRDSNCCTADPIGDYNKPRIAVVQEDLDGVGDSGHWDVWMKKYPGEVLISWESGTFSSNSGVVNAQVRLFANGYVVICYGPGDLDGNTFAAGIEGKENDDLWINESNPISYPLPGYPFNSDGITNVWPDENQCYLFTPDSGFGSWIPPTDSPSQSPTTPPPTLSQSPSLSPTVACCDSGWNMTLFDNVISCADLAIYPYLCYYQSVGSFCKETCNTCADYGCMDSTATFIPPLGSQIRCRFLDSLNPDTLAYLCASSPDLQCICSESCGVCV